MIEELINNLVEAEKIAADVKQAFDIAKAKYDTASYEVEQCKRHIVVWMQDNNTEEYTLSRPVFSYKVALTTPRQSVKIVDDSAVPDEYARVVTTRSPDKNKIKDAIQAGAQFNWASMEYGNPSLTVKMVRN
jgi:RNase adaptor protein for sRNA GlmZ degradation